MTHRLRQVKRRPVTYAAAGTVAACGILGAVGAAGAAQQAAEVRIGMTASQFNPADEDIATGDTVVWDFSGGVYHNVASDAGPPEDPNWPAFATPIQNAGEARYTFTRPGEYSYVCEVHAGMTGTLSVTGPPVDPTPTPTPTTTATPTPTPTTTATPTPTPVPDDHTMTPPPAGVSASDNSAPGVSGIRLSGKRRLAKVRFRLTETATVTVRVKQKSKVLRTVRLQMRAGTRTVTVRSAKLKRGRYTIELQARDATGRSSAVQRASFRIAGK